MRGTAVSGTNVGVGRAIVTLMPQPASVPPAAATAGSANRRVNERRRSARTDCIARDYRAPAVGVSVGVVTRVAAGAVAVLAAVVVGEDVGGVTAPVVGERAAA